MEAVAAAVAYATVEDPRPRPPDGFLSCSTISTLLSCKFFGCFFTLEKKKKQLRLYYYQWQTLKPTWHTALVERAMASPNVIRAGPVNHSIKSWQSLTGMRGLSAPQKSVPFQNPAESLIDSLPCIHLAVVSTKVVQVSHIGSSFRPPRSPNKGLRRKNREKNLINTRKLLLTIRKFQEEIGKFP